MSKEFSSEYQPGDIKPWIQYSSEALNPEQNKDGIELIDAINSYSSSSFSEKINTPLKYTHALMESLFNDKIVVHGIVGPPGNGKSGLLIHMDTYMFDPERNFQIVGGSDNFAKTVVVYDLQWGSGYRAVNSRVTGDYHTSEQLRSDKIEELDIVAGKFFSDFDQIYNFAKNNPLRSDMLQIIRYDLPLITGVSNDSESIGMPRGDREYKQMINMLSDDEEVSHFVVGMFASKDVKDHTYSIRKSVEDADTLEEKVEKLVDHGVVFNREDFSDDEISKIIENMARTFQMDSIIKDVDQVVAHLLKNKDISIKGDESKINELVNNLSEGTVDRDEIYDESIGQTLNWYLKEHIGIPTENGAIFKNERVMQRVNFKKPKVPIQIYQGYELIDNT